MGGRGPMISRKARIFLSAMREAQNFGKKGGGAKNG